MIQTVNTDATGSACPDAIHLAVMSDRLRAPAAALLGIAEILTVELARLGYGAHLPDAEQIVTSARALIQMIDDKLNVDNGLAVPDADADEIATLEKRLRHDLRTPLAGIQGYAEILLEDLEDEPCDDIKTDIAKLLESSRQLLDQIDVIVRFDVNDLADGEASRADAAATAQMIEQLSQSITNAGESVSSRYGTGAILVVDDQQSNRDLLQRMLTRDGHVVCEAADGREALELMRSQPFDLVLLDLMMSGMNGYDTLIAINEDDALKHIPVIMISALDEMDSAIRCIEVGAVDYLPKPIEPVLLKARIGTSLDRKRARDRERHYLQRIETEKAMSEKLLQNILPEAIIERMNAGEELIADRFDDISILFSDFVGFTRISAGLEPSELIRSLNEVFCRFDLLALELGAEKIKTIGDAYMVVAGMPDVSKDHPSVIAEMALGMRAILDEINPTIPHPFDIRIGINCGPAVAGIIGRHKFVYDVWGDSVNMASRMESYAEPGMIHMSAEMAERLRDRYPMASRGVRDIRGKGRVETYMLLNDDNHPTRKWETGNTVNTIPLEIARR